MTTDRHRSSREIGVIHTAGGAHDWREVHTSMRARGYTSKPDDSLWHAPDGHAAIVVPDGTGRYRILSAD